MIERNTVSKENEKSKFKTPKATGDTLFKKKAKTRQQVENQTKENKDAQYNNRGERG